MYKIQGKRTNWSENDSLTESLQIKKKLFFFVSPGMTLQHRLPVATAGTPERCISFH